MEWNGMGWMRRIEWRYCGQTLFVGGKSMSRRLFLFFVEQRDWSKNSWLITPFRFARSFVHPSSVSGRHSAVRGKPTLVFFFFPVLVEMKTNTTRADKAKQSKAKLTHQTYEKNTILWRSIVDFYLNVWTTYFSFLNYTKRRYRQSFPNSTITATLLLS